MIEQEPVSVLPVIKLPAVSNKGDLHLNTLLDTASTASFITVSALEPLEHIIRQTDTEISIKQLNGSRKECVDTVTIFVRKGNFASFTFLLEPRWPRVFRVSIPSSPRFAINFQVRISQK